MLLDHLDGILNYCRTKVPLGVVEAVNGNIKSLLRRGRGYKNLRYLLLKAQPGSSRIPAESRIFKVGGLSYPAAAGKVPGPQTRRHFYNSLQTEQMGFTRVTYSIDRREEELL
ncbi:MAG: transposase [Bryobacteraceae bacterium]